MRDERGGRGIVRCRDGQSGRHLQRKRQHDAAYLAGSRGTTANAGGQFIAAANSTIELGGLLVNYDNWRGVLDVNLGGVARGSGTFGTVNVGSNGTFGVNAPATGGGTIKRLGHDSPARALVWVAWA